LPVIAAGFVTKVAQASVGKGFCLLSTRIVDKSVHGDPGHAVGCLTSAAVLGLDKKVPSALISMDSVTCP
jgi:hypothetical protein